MRKIIVLLTLLLPLVLLSGEYEIGTTIKNAKVVRVADGDTLVALKDKDNIKIRLWGVDAPEKSQDFGRASQSFLKELLNSNDGVIDIRVKGYDKYGRMIAVVYSGGKDVANESVSNGFAWVYTKYNESGVYKIQESLAKELKKGLWSSPNRVAPWEFRKQYKAQAQARNETQLKGDDIIKLLYKLGR